MPRRLLTATLVSLSLAGCMIVVHDQGDGGGVGDGTSKPKTLHAQMLVMINLDPSVVSMASGYATLIAGYQKALALQTPRIWVDQIALAPLNRTTASGARFIYSEQDADPNPDGTADAGPTDLGGTGTSTPPPTSPPSTVDAGSAQIPVNPSRQALGDGTLLGQILQEALTYQYLPEDPNRGEQQNLAELGATISDQAVYQLDGSDPGATPIFGAPEDLFIVLTINHLHRPCAPADANCLIQGQTPMGYFSAVDGNGHATWLNFGGGAGLPLKHIFHYSIVTEEGAAPNFFDRCAREPGIPQNYVDNIEPSPIAYYGPFTSAFKPSDNVFEEDFCDMMSSQAAYHVVLDTHQIAGVMSN